MLFSYMKKADDDVVCSFFPSSLFGWVVRFSRRLAGSGRLRAGDRAAAIKIEEKKKRCPGILFLYWTSEKV